jgi:hypothetical protein
VSLLYRLLFTLARMAAVERRPRARMWGPAWPRPMQVRRVPVPAIDVRDSAARDAAPHHAARRDVARRDVARRVPTR